MIKSIEMINFLSHNNTRIDFTSGTNVFVGHNGAGKSSVIDAINFALYSKHSRNDNKNLIKRDENESNVKLVFSIRNRTFKAERKLSRNDTSKSVLYEIKDGKEIMLVTGERRQFEESMTREIENLIGLDYDKMSIASIIEQGKIMDVLTAKPKEFKELINNIIDINKLDDVALKFREDLKQFTQKQRDKLGGFLPEDIPRLEQSIQEYKQENDTISHDIDINNDQLNTIKLDISNVKSNIQDYNTYQDKLNEINTTKQQYDKYVNQRKQDIQDKIDTDNTTINEIIQKGKDDIAKITAEISDIHNTIKQTRDIRDKRNKELEESIKTIKSQISEYNDIKQKLAEHDISDDDITKTQQQISDIQQKLDESNHDIITMNERLGITDKLQIHDGKCPLCNSTVDKLVDIFNPYEIELHIKETNKVIQELDNNKSILMDKLNKLEEVSKQNDIYRDRIKDMDDNTITQLQQDIEQKTKELNNTDTSMEIKLLASISEKQKALEHDGISTQDKQKIDSIQNIITENTKKLKDYTDDFAESIQQKISQLEQDMSNYTIHDISQLEQTLSQLEHKLNTTNNNIGAMNERLRNNKEEITKINNTIPKLDKLNRFTQYIQNINDKVYSRDSPVAHSLRFWALSMISNRASEYIDALNTNINRIVITEKKRSVSITCYQSNKQLDIKSLSGGEKISVALAIRLAMSHILGTSGTNLMILDEPTIYLDENAKKSFVDVLNKLTNIENVARTQFIIITHDTEIFDNSKVDKIMEFKKNHQGTYITNK